MELVASDVLNASSNQMSVIQMASSISQGTQTDGYCCDSKKREEEFNQKQKCPVTEENFSLNAIPRANDPYQSSRNENNASKGLVRNKNIHQQKSKEQLTAQLEEERAKVARLQRENMKQRETISASMEKAVEENTKGRCDIANDPRSPKHIASKFDDIYCTEWEQAFDFLESISVEEIEIVKCLKEILESCYDICLNLKTRNILYERVKVTQAEQQGNDQQLFSESGLQSLLDMGKSMKGHGLQWLKRHIELQINDRYPKRYTERDFNDQQSPCDTESKSTKKKKRKNRSKTKPEQEKSGNDGNQSHQEERRNIQNTIHRINRRSPDILQNSILKEYINACLKSCWEAVSCEPELKLKFSIQNTPYAKVESLYRYKQYIFDSPVSDRNVKNDESILVVWPVVICEDQSGNECVIETKNAWVIVNNT